MTRELFEEKKAVWSDIAIKIRTKATIYENEKFMEIFNLKEWDIVDFRAENWLSTTRREWVVTEWKIFKDVDWLFKIKSVNLLGALYEKPWISRSKWNWHRLEFYIAPITYLEFVDHNFKLS